MKKTITILSFILILMVACKSTESGREELKSQSTKSVVQNLAFEKYGENFTLTYNSTKEYTLCQSTSGSAVPNNGVTNYFIYDNSNNLIINENKIINGTITWYSNYEVKIVKIPGMIQKEQSHEDGHIFNIKTNSKTKINGGVH